MRKSRFSLLLLTAFGWALTAKVAQAQLVTFDTISAYETGDAQQGIAQGDALTQGLSEISYIDSMTYRFISQGNSQSETNSILTAYLVAWDTTTDKAVNSTPLWSETFTVPPEDTFTTDQFAGSSATYQGYDATLNIETALDPSQTYAMVLINQSAGSPIGLLNIENDDPFVNPNTGDTLGDNYRKASAGSLANLVTTKSSDFGGAWGFSQIIVTPFNPAPEPRTAAAMLAGLLVAFLVGRRLLAGAETAPAGAAV